MSWVKVDDGLHAHVKPMRAGLEAMGLWVLCASYAGFSEHDGFVEREVVVRQAGSEERAAVLAELLVAAGLWVAQTDGWVFHDWLDFNISRAELNSTRRNKAKAGRKGGVARAKQLLSSRQAPATGLLDHDQAPVPSRPDPTRPVPSRPEEEEKTKIKIPQLQLVEPGKPCSKYDSDVRAVFERWAEHRKRKHSRGPAPVLDEKRAKVIRDRLTEGHPVENLQDAVEGIWYSRFHLGENDRGEEYTSIGLALRDADKIEKLAGIARSIREERAEEIARRDVAKARRAEAAAKAVAE